MSMRTITIHATGTMAEIADCVEQVAEQIREGYVCGQGDSDTNWDSDIPL